MRCVALLVLCCVSSAALPGCIPAGSRHVEAQLAAPAAPHQTLRPGDRLHITVYGEDGMSGDYEIGEAGEVGLPLLGRLSAAGQSQEAFQDTLTAALKAAYFKNPRVTVATLSVRPFYILGEVTKPGEYPYRSGLDVWRAMALAGGQTYRASTSTVEIQRAGEDAFHDYQLTATVAIEPGDIVRVPERWF